MKRILLVTLVCLFLIDVVVPYASAASLRFKDVAPDFWGYEAIETVAYGGLIKGYGNGKFGPNDTLTIDQMATLICRAKGYPEYAKDGYWAYGALENCRRVGCLPLFEELTAENFSVPCTREMAAYMVVRGLVVGNSVPDERGTGKVFVIPDYRNIKAAYENAVLYAYETGLIIGIDDAGTFDPQGALTRAQACVLLCRAGYTAVAEYEVNMEELGKSIFAIYDEIEHWDGWREWIGRWGTNGQRYNEIPNYYLNATMYTYGDVKVGCSYTNHLLTITIQEPGGWTYEARQLVKRILAVAYPTSYQTVYDDFLGVMKSELFETPRFWCSSTISWLDNRLFHAHTDQSSYSLTIYIGEIGDVTHYERMLNEEASGRKEAYKTKSRKDVVELYELDRG